MAGISGRVWRTPARPLEPWESPEGNWTRSRLALAELQAVVDQLPPTPRPAPTALPSAGQKVSR